MSDKKWIVKYVIFVLKEGSCLQNLV